MNTYTAPVAIHPGESLKDMLLSLHMTQIKLSQRAGLSKKTVNEIIMGKTSVTPDTAIKFSSVFGMSADFWNNLQRQYDETLTRLHVKESLSKDLATSSRFKCYKELVKLGCVPETKNKFDKISALRNFFKVSSLDRVPLVQSMAFRMAKQKKISQEALAAWIRCGEMKAELISTKPFNRAKLIAGLPELRSLTRLSAKEFPGKIIEICSEFGIAVVFLPYFNQSGVNGMVKFLNPNKALLLLSLRGLYEDTLWFSLFHELGHLIYHGKKHEIIEIANSSTQKTVKEMEADSFASSNLIAPKDFDFFLQKNDFSNESIKQFSEKIYITPSIVAGRLSHHFNNWTSWVILRKKINIDDFLASIKNHAK